MTLTQEIQFEDIERANENNFLRMRILQTGWTYCQVQTDPYSLDNSFKTHSFLLHFQWLFLTRSHQAHYALTAQMLSAFFELYKTPHIYIIICHQNSLFESLMQARRCVIPRVLEWCVCESVIITSSPVSDVVDNPLQALIQSAIKKEKPTLSDTRQFKGKPTTSK